MDDVRPQTGIVLLNLGGPDCLEAVEPFLFNLFSDPDIIAGLPGPLRKRIAGRIARKRAPQVRKYYEALGGKSPLNHWTDLQAQALAEATGLPTYVAMRYWHPFSEEAAQAVWAARPKQVVLLPLYPHYSRTTTGSSLKAIQKALPKGLEVLEVRDYHDDPTYIQAVVERIREGLARFPHPERVHLLFSAHGVPVSVIRKGDPYQEQIERTCRLIGQQFANASSLAYQSRVGPEKWLEPSSETVIFRLAWHGVQEMLVVPVSFVSDHSETLYEIDVTYRALAEELGVTQFELMPALNDSPTFIQALAGCVQLAIRQKA